MLYATVGSVRVKTHDLIVTSCGGKSLQFVVTFVLIKRIV